ncbi:MAG: hypothetical protein HF973_08695 [Chloroflexi bacterium]|nr:hypothetical protein [Chloroflexota bacterium]
MPSRQNNRYSINEKTGDIRKTLLELLLVAIILGALLQWLSEAIFSTVDAAPLPLWLRWLLWFLVFFLSLIVFWWFWQRNNSIRSATAAIDVLLPFEVCEESIGNKTKAAIITIPAPEKPAYSLLINARKLFVNGYNRQMRQKLASEFLDSSLDFRNFFYTHYHQLLDALILQTIAWYGQRSLGKESRVKWLQVRLPVATIILNDLPPRLQENPFISATRQRKILLPEGFSIDVKNTSAGWRWCIDDGRFGQVVVDINKTLSLYPWRSQSQKIRILREGLPPPPDNSQYLALGARLETVAELRGLLQISQHKRQAADNYHEWLTRLVFFLEEALDWEYYMTERRPMQLLVNLTLAVDDLKAQLDGLLHEA